MTFFISYFYVKNTYDDFDVQMERFVQEYYENQKKFLKKEIDTMVDILKYNSTKEGLTQEEIKEDMIRLLNNISFQENKSNYVFVYDIKNISGGDDFARMVVNPNRPDLYGKLISTHYKDADGKKFREDFLKDIREKGESYTQYAYKKPHSIDIKQKLSYFKHYPAWNWVIAAGVYIDDIEKELEHKRKALKLRVKTQVIQNILLFVLFLSIAIVMSILVSQKIDEVLKNYRDNVKAKSRQLQELNNSLERRVFEEIDKNREKEQLLVQKSRFIALGEMISNIAHQWRQPLSELSSLLMSIKFKHDMGKLDSDAMARKSQEAEKVIDFMSHTIDDFRNFFKTHKTSADFSIEGCFSKVFTLIHANLNNKSINVIQNIDPITLVGYENELIQALLNILNNSRDALLGIDEEETRYIFIRVYQKDTHVIIEIKDNAKGIDEKILPKIFEPYFTTKHQSQGTGIGLYMTKQIIESSLLGSIRISNVEYTYEKQTYKGTLNEIRLPLKL
jgi:signal transduction histidine kinase